MNDSNQEITLQRDCEAIQIPSGTPFSLSKGSPVIIRQALGGSYTVATHQGLARIEAKDADALGLETAEPDTGADSKPEAGATGEAGEVGEDQVWEQLKTVYDPEIPVNIVDLGLVYDCRISRNDDGATKVDVKMTLTAPGCGMGPAIAADAQSKVLTVPGVDEAEVELVWDPPWNQNMISEAGRMKLGLV